MSQSPSTFMDSPTTPSPYSFNTKVMVGAIIVLFVVILFIVILHVYARWFLHRSSRSYVISRRHALVSSLGAASSAHNSGLDKAVIAQLPTFVYAATSHVDGLEAGKPAQSPARPAAPECAVCLSEFQDNEKGRMLPACKHIFHTDCIDAWFLSHSTCPLCRTEVVPAMATSASADQHHQGHEAAVETSLDAVEGDRIGLHPVEYPCNVLFWGNQTQVVSSEEPASSSSSLPLAPSLRMPGARVLPQITIDIAPIEGHLLVRASERLSAKSTPVEQEASSSQALKSPGLRASIKKILSRQSSSRQKTSSQEGREESPK